MGIVLWKNKGSELSPQELDGNFEDLSKRVGLLEGLETNAQVLQEVALEGDELLFHGYGGALLGRVRLPVPQLYFKGAWREGQDYTYADVVRQGQALYFCHSAHPGKATFCTDDWAHMLGEDDVNNASSSQGHASSTLAHSHLSQLLTYDEAHMPAPQMGALAVALGVDGASLMLGMREGWHRIASVPLS